MVEVKYVGRMGNHLFTYAAARVIAESLRYKLVAPPVVGFGGTYNIVNGAAYHNPVERITRDELPDLNGILRNQSRRKIVVAAYCQKYDYIRARAGDVKAWYRQPPPEQPLATDAVVVQIRLTDFAAKFKWSIAMDYYTAVLDEYFAGRPVVVITDEPTHPCLRVLDKYSPVYLNSAALEQFRAMTAAKDLIIGTSTFAWWAAFLSQARVFAPLLKRGYYFGPSNRNENYIVDEDRYYYVEDVGLLHE
jgi:hypothetical protein